MKKYIRWQVDEFVNGIQYRAGDIIEMVEGDRDKDFRLAGNNWNFDNYRWYKNQIQLMPEGYNPENQPIIQEILLEF